MKEKVNHSLYEVFKSKDERFDGRVFIDVSQQVFIADQYVKPNFKKKKIVLTMLLQQMVLDLV